MNAEKLYRAIGMIDDEFIDEAADVKAGKARKAGLAAACAVAAAIVLCAIFLPLGRNEDMAPPESTVDESAVSVTQPTEWNSTDSYALILNAAEGQYARMDAGLQFSYGMDEAQKGAVLPGLSECGEINAVAVYDQYGGLKRVSAGFIPDGTVATEGVEANICLYPESTEARMDYLFDCQPQPSYIMGYEIIAGEYVMAEETAYFASFVMDDMAYYVELMGGKAEKAALPAIIDRIICGGEADISGLADPEIPELRNDELDCTQAYSDKDFGGYLPEVKVNGLEFESARRYIDQNNDYLTVLWSQWETQGYDQIYLTVSGCKESDSVRIVSSGDKEKYDLSLYPIPRAESVPEELYEVVNDPIFRAEEITLDEVYARSYILEEAGDSNGYRMSFSVLFGDTVVKFDSKGQTPEAIYDMIMEIKEKN